MALQRKHKRILRIFFLLILIFFLFPYLKLLFNLLQLFLYDWDTQIPLISSLNSLKSDSQERIIPRIIHQTYKNNHSIPSLWLSTMESCKREKEFKFILWTDEQIDEFIKTEYPEFYTKVFIKYPYNIQRVDAFRYFVLYSYGGIYMDLDIGCVDSSSNHHHPLTFLIDGLLPFNYETIFPKTSPFGVSNDLIISTKHSSFLLYLIKNLEYYYYNNEYFLLKFPTVMFSTGPAFVDLNLISYSNNKKDVGILDPKFYSYSNQKFFYHVHGSSWHGIDAKVFHFYHEHTGIAVVLTVMFVIVGLYMVWKCCRNLL